MKRKITTENTQSVFAVYSLLPPHILRIPEQGFTLLVPTPAQKICSSLKLRLCQYNKKEHSLLYQQKTEVQMKLKKALTSCILSLTHSSLADLCGLTEVVKASIQHFHLKALKLERQGGGKSAHTFFFSLRTYEVMGSTITAFRY